MALRTSFQRMAIAATRFGTVAPAVGRAAAAPLSPAVATHFDHRRSPQRRCRSTAVLEGSLAAEEPEPQRAYSEAPSASKHGRWAYTVEIMVSKLFPGGFGWQYSSICAEEVGFAPESAEFALTTGFGDATGVLLGHMTYKIGQKLLTDHDIDLAGELGTSVWLGGGALVAGGMWQPAVNFFQGMNMTFTPCMVSTFATCGALFFVGLRAGRAVMPWMPDGDSANAKQDAGLAVSIGGATGMFVATDLSFAAAAGGGDTLFKTFSPVFGVTEADTGLMGCVKAGGSTLTGFGLTNMFQSIFLPAGANWMDGNNPYSKKQ